jgi:ribosome biogenesis GTPase
VGLWCGRQSEEPLFDLSSRRSGENGMSMSRANAWEVNCGMKVGTELLCMVRAVLKKIKRRVLVGDRVLVSGIDWTDHRGMVEDVLDRRLEIAKPLDANVEHLLVLFTFNRPKLEPTALSRFFIEAESTGILSH